MRPTGSIGTRPSCSRSSLGCLLRHREFEVPNRTNQRVRGAERGSMEHGPYASGTVHSPQWLSRHGYAQQISRIRRGMRSLGQAGQDECSPADIGGNGPRLAAARRRGRRQITINSRFVHSPVRGFLPPGGTRLAPFAQALRASVRPPRAPFPNILAQNAGTDLILATSTPPSRGDVNAIGCRKFPLSLSIMGIPFAFEVGDQRRAEVAIGLVARISRKILAEQIERLLADAQCAAV
jgi:hypothetical protein